jgi:hypothetical protein
MISKFVAMLIFMMFSTMALTQQESRKLSDNHVLIAVACNTPQNMMNMLNQHGERVFMNAKARVLTANNQVIHVALGIAMSPTGDFTVFIVDREGASCVVTAGEELMPVVPLNKESGGEIGM